MKKEKQKRGPVKKRWAFLVYIAGDNDLSDAGLEDVQELCDEGASEDIHVGVEIDTYGEHTGSIRYEITEPDWTGQAYRTVIQRLPEKDSGDPETLRAFLRWGFRRYPGENNVVVVWNHGAGFRTVRRDIGYDDFGSSLDMPEIENAFRRSGIGPNKRVAILGFDACLMSMIEIVHHFRNQVEVVVGSQQTEPGDGWPYDRVLHEMKRSTSRTDLAKRIVREYIKAYRKVGIFNVTQSAIETAKTDRAIQALSHLGDLLVENFDSIYAGMKRIRLRLQSFEMADYVDLVHLAELISKEIENGSISDAAKAVVGSTLSCILASERLGAAVKDANGLSIWFPAYQSLYFNYRAKYLALKCNRDHRGWIKFLDLFHS
jgi:hypothetical protein